MQSRGEVVLKLFLSGRGALQRFLPEQAYLAEYAVPAS
jgi:hypothetical protein